MTTLINYGEILDDALAQGFETFPEAPQNVQETLLLARMVTDINSGDITDWLLDDGPREDWTKTMLELAILLFSGTAESVRDLINEKRREYYANRITSDLEDRRAGYPVPVLRGY